MEQKQILTIVVVAIVIVAAAAVAITALGNNKDSSSVDVDATVVIYGNANNDWRIDSEDVSFVQSIINGETTWNKTTNPYADANNDGSITQEDVDLINKIINNEGCTVYYLNYFGETQAINYPLVNNRIMVNYWQQAEAVAILGHWNEVVVASAAATELYPDLYPDDNCVTVGTTGSSTKAAEATETIINEKVDLIIATASTACKSAYAVLESSYPDIQIIYLWHSGDSVIPTILTLGILMCSEEKAEAYAEFVTSQMDAIEDKISQLDELPTVVTLITYSNTAERAQNNGGYAAMLTDTEGAHYLIGKISNVMYGPDESGWGYSYRNIEWFLEHDSEIDFIIGCEASIGFNSGSTKATYNERFETNVELFNQLTCYGEGKYIGSVYSFLGGFSGTAMLPLIAYMLYPDLFSESEALETLQYWFNNFTAADIDVNDMGGYYYTGDKYDIWYNRDDRSSLSSEIVTTFTVDEYQAVINRI
ncbi:MAG: ABC transporter substrate-binding protein [Thermoplasmata archaeon]|nr:ABC transporter substrate-binding protein [Thermoplasmata archaeon]